MITFFLLFNITNKFLLKPFLLVFDLLKKLEDSSLGYGAVLLLKISQASLFQQVVWINYDFTFSIQLVTW